MRSRELVALVSIVGLLAIASNLSLAVFGKRGELFPMTSWQMFSGKPRDSVTSFSFLVRGEERSLRLQPREFLGVPWRAARANLRGLRSQVEALCNVPLIATAPATESLASEEWRCLPESDRSSIRRWLNLAERRLGDVGGGVELSLEVVEQSVQNGSTRRRLIARWNRHATEYSP